MKTYPTCCNSEPIFLITFEVDNKKTKYNVCDNCSKLEYFKNHVLNKISLEVET